jgi:MFS family permease
MRSGKHVSDQQRRLFTPLNNSMNEATQKTDTGRPINRDAAMRFIVLLGIVSLFADMTYEGARSVTGPFLGSLGASGAVVGVIAGLGELVGYGTRLASGWLGDRSQRYWTVTITGYVINLLAVPALALTWRWEAAAVLIVIERAGRAVRSPGRDAMLSHAASHTGLGWGFGLHEAMDQTGAIIGPLLVSAVLSLRYNYAEAFTALILPALASIIAVFVARSCYPRPCDFDLTPAHLGGADVKQPYWLYATAVALIGAGYADFALIAYHFSQTAVVRPPLIPILYATAMGSDAIASLLLGRLFDRYGLIVVPLGTVAVAAASPLVFLGGLDLAVVGIVLWGIGMSLQESLMRAVVASMTAPSRRATAFGLLNAIFGAAWFTGSSLLGILYDRSLVAVSVTSLTLQLLAVPVLLAVMRKWSGGRDPGERA